MLHPAIAHPLTMASDLARQISEELVLPEMESIENFDWVVTRTKVLLAGLETLRPAIVDPTK